MSAGASCCQYRVVVYCDDEQAEYSGVALKHSSICQWAEWWLSE